jgi:dCTP deaminase
VELLTKQKLNERIYVRGDAQLCITPILEETQIGDVSIDSRLGADFMVSVLTRKPFVGVVRADKEFRGSESYFQNTRREFGDRVVLYPNQLSLACTLEYIALPLDVYADVLSRSSYTRLGIHINTMVQPGFRGCFPLELFNHGNNPVELVVGSRICQARFFELGSAAGYHSPSRKYFGNVRPVASRAPDDWDIEKLEAIREPR